MRRIQIFVRLVILKLVRFLPLFFLLFVLRPAFAQTSQLEGTVTQTHDGVTAKAAISWQPPNSLKIEIARDDAAQIPAQTIVATGNQTLLWLPATRRLQRLPYNFAQQWQRGWNLQFGGPANFFFTGTQSEMKLASFLARDLVLFGGGGNSSYYAAYKSPRRVIASEIKISEKSREEKNESGTVLMKATIELAENLPKTAKVLAPSGEFTFEYDLKPRAEAFAENTFSIGDEKAIIEDAELKIALAYSEPTANAQFNRGLALWRGAGDLDGAFQAWDEAAKLAPEASAPVLASFETALETRDLNRAAASLEKLAKLPVEKAEIQTRRARLLAIQRDWDAAKTALEAAQTAAPQNLAITLARSEMARSRGDFESAQSLLLEIVASNLPQRETQLAAAEFLAAFVVPGEENAILAKIPAQTVWQKLARSHLQLLSGQKPETSDFSDDLALASLATGFERAGQDEEAKTRWQTLETRASDDLKSLARAHLIGVLVRRGDDAAALKTFKNWNESLNGEAEKRAAQDALFEAFQKNFRVDSLRATLQNRALATVVSSEDLKLWLAFQERYGQNKDISDALELAIGRYAKEPFWAAKNAELFFDRASSQSDLGPGPAARARFLQQALAELDKAIAAQPNQPYYQIQKSLAAVQNAARNAAIIDANRATAARKQAKNAMDELRAAFPDDPDVAVSLALQNLALGSKDEAQIAAQDAQRALNLAPGGLEFDGDRHILIAAARQALAQANRKLGNVGEAVSQYQLLAREANDAVEASGYFGAGLATLNESKDNGAPFLVARWLEKIAGEPWDYQIGRLYLENAANRLSATDLAPSVLAILAAQPTGAARLAEVSLASAIAERAAQIAAQEGAPPAADAAKDKAARDLQTAFARLPELVTGQNKLLAARAAALVAETSTGDALALLQTAIALEPREPALRFTLIESLIASGRTDEAKVARDAALQVLPPAPETARRLTALSLQLDEPKKALAIALPALRAAQVSPGATANQFQGLAIFAGRALFANTQYPAGLAIYNGLASAQWNDLDRAAALIALADAWRSAGRAEEAEKVVARLGQLKLSREQLETANGFLMGL